ncbi:phosphatidylinositol-binding protein scs2 [Microbotryomycetes sp. JL221]|nr:phosphatidylinositol-binding protein scs2 [Microbotryomycetes sp. JL221]
MSVSLSPSSQLGFPRTLLALPVNNGNNGPLTQLVKKTLSVTNSNQQPVAYKVKTTAPKQYCVRPNSGRIEPGETVEVQVLLQPMKEEPAPGTKCRDKFLVQSVIIDGSKQDLGLQELWTSVEKEDKASIHEQKIRCAYLSSQDGANGTYPIQEEEKSSIQSDSRQGSSAAAADQSFSSTVAGNETTSTPPPTGDKASTLTSTAGGFAAGAAAAVGLTGVASSISDKSGAAAANNVSAKAETPTTDLDKLRAQLSAAQAEITSLKSQLQNAESTNATLRSRGAGAKQSTSDAAGTAQAVAERKSSEGVPVQTVLVIAAGVFVVTWLFF